MGALDLQWWLIALQICVIDILLSGDNAVVIALACRNLSAAHRRLGIFWGVFGAVALRIVLLFFALQLLAIPYLKLCGGLLLLWIGYQLLVPEEEGGGDDQESGATSLGSAIRTIILADVVMSVDNVVAVAAAAKGNFALVVMGVAVSIPIAVWGSQLVLKLIERFPVVVTAGGALLGWIAGEMLVSDVAVQSWLGDASRWAHYSAAATGAVLVVLAGKLTLMRRTRVKPLDLAIDPKAGGGVQ